MESPSLALYVVASLALIATPGQDMIYVVARSLAQGRLAGACSAIGVCLGILVHTALVALGIGAVLQANAGLFLGLKLAGAAYLVYVGIRMLLSSTTRHDFAHESARVAPLALIGQGVLSNVTNPKVILFFFAFLPQFVDPARGHVTRDLVFLGVLYAVLALPVKLAVGIGAGSLADTVFRPRIARWMNRFGGVVLIALGLRLAAAESR